MKLKDWYIAKEKLISRTVLLLLVIVVSMLLVYEQSAPLSSLAGRTWAFVSGLIASAWTSFQWPHAALLIFVLALINFRAEMRILISRVRKIGEIADFFPAPEQDAEKKETAAAVAGGSTATQPVSTLQPANPLRLAPPVDFPTEYSASMASVRAEIDGQSDADAKNYLMQMYAHAKVNYEFENLYSNIFGGQIRLLSMMNQRFPGGLPLLDIISYWPTHQATWSKTFDEWTPDRYMSFLYARALCVNYGENVLITNKGREFLIWIVKCGREQNKIW